MAHQPGVPWLWTNGTCHRPLTSPTNVRWYNDTIYSQNLMKSLPPPQFLPVSREGLPVRTNRLHSPRCLRWLNTACDRITYNRWPLGPKPLKWLTVENPTPGSMHKSTDLSERMPPHEEDSHKDSRGSAQVQGLKCATHICAPSKIPLASYWASARIVDSMLEKGSSALYSTYSARYGQS